MSDLNRELDIAIDAVRRAAIGCRDVQASLDPAAIEKKDRSPVTIADFASQALICRAIGNAFADDPIIGEEDSTDLRNPDNAVVLSRVTSHVAALVDETVDEDQVCAWIDRGGAKEFSPRFWTLDPIDGTKGFLRGEHYAISLALIVDGALALGVVGCPKLEHAGEAGVLFTAITGDAAMARPLFGEGDPQPIQVTENPAPTKARFCESVESAHSSHDDAGRLAAFLGITTEPYRIDSQAKYGAIASGLADIYLRLPTRPGYVEKIWDHAGGAAIVAAAGGRVTDVDGKPLEFNHGHELSANRGVIATNGLLHGAVINGLDTLRRAADASERT